MCAWHTWQRIFESETHKCIFWGISHMYLWKKNVRFIWEINNSLKTTFTRISKLNSKTVYVSPSLDLYFAFPFHLLPSLMHPTGFSFHICSQASFSFLSRYLTTTLKETLYRNILNQTDCSIHKKIYPDFVWFKQKQDCNYTAPIDFKPVTGWGWCAHAGILGLLTFFASSRPLLYS